MGYELLLLRVPKGADVEESGEALAVRIQTGQVRASAAGRARELSALLAGSLPELLAAPGDEEGALPIEMRGPGGLRLDVTDGFVRVEVPYALFGEEAEEMFGRVFALLGAAAASTGWLAYDPQRAAGTELDEAGCSATQELYLSVMDQLYPGGVAERRRGGPPRPPSHRPSGTTE